MRILRPCLVVLLSLISIVSAAGAPRSSQIAPAACLNGTCALYLPLLRYDVAPALLEPSQAAQLTTLAPTLSWRPITTGTHKIQVSTDAGFTLSASFVMSSTKSVKLPLPAQVNTAFTSNLKGATTFFWRVGVALPQGGTAFSSIQSFTTPAEDAVQLPGLVPILSPRNNGNITGSRVLLKWGAISGALLYRIRMFDAAGNAFDPGTVQVSGSQTTFWVNNIPKGIYTWKIKAITAAGWGEYGDDYTFRIS